jgi:hypothetical protein
MANLELYDYLETTLKDLKVDYPEWIDDKTFNTYQVGGIIEGGCSSGAFMPAVYYTNALKVMNKHGNDVFDYLTTWLDKLPRPPKDQSWSGLASFYLCFAIDHWAHNHELEILNALKEHYDEEENEEKSVSEEPEAQSGQVVSNLRRSEMARNALGA